MEETNIGRTESTSEQREKSHQEKPCRSQEWVHQGQEITQQGRVNIAINLQDSGSGGFGKQAADILTHYYLVPSICLFRGLTIYVNFKFTSCWIHTHIYRERAWQAIVHRVIGFQRVGHYLMHTNTHIYLYLYFRLNNTEDISQEYVFHFLLQGWVTRSLCNRQFQLRCYFRICVSF